MIRRPCRPRLHGGDELDILAPFRVTDADGSANAYCARLGPYFIDIAALGYDAEQNGTAAN
jgi:hypothetical protein